MTNFKQLGFFCAFFGIPSFVLAVTPVMMQLDWIYNVQFAGLYQAEAQGYFTEAGLDVELKPVDPDQKTVASVLSSKDRIAFGSAESNVLLAASAAGAPIKAVATMFQGSPMGWMVMPDSDIQTIEDFAGKRIGVHPDGEKVIQVMCRHHEITPEDFTLPHVGYDLEVLMKGEIDAMQAYETDEFVKLQLLTDGESNIILARDNGYHAYSQVIFTTRETVQERPEVVRRFLDAVQKGWDYALDNPEQTVDLVIKDYNPDLDRDYQIASLQRIKHLVQPEAPPSLAPMDREVWEKSQKLYLEFGLIEKAADLDELVDLRFNP